MTAYQTFLADPLRRDIFLVELYPYDPDTEATTTLYCSSDEYFTLPSETPASTVYEPIAVNGINREAASVVPGTTGILPLAHGGELRLSNLYGALDSWRDYHWDGRRCVVKHTGVSRTGRLAHADAQVLFDGEIGAFLPGVDDATIYLRNPEARFDHPITSKVFRGTRYCLYFDGATHYVSHGAPAKLDITAALTVEGWFYFDDTGTAVRIAGWTGGTAWPFRLERDATNHLKLVDSASFALTSTLTVTSKRWYHIAWIVESATAARLLVYDSVADTENEETFSGASYTSRAAISGSPTFYLGSTANFFEGLQDDVRVWSSARTADEIRAARHRPLTTTEAALSALELYAKLDDGTGATVTDSAASAANGTITGTPAWYWAMEGDEAMAGTPKPDAWGLCENVPLVDVGLPTPVQFIASTEIEALDELYEGGYSNYTAGTAYTDLVTFLAASTAVGAYDTLIYPGGSYVRTKSRPTKPMTADVQGDASGSGYVSTAGAIARRILTTRGPSPLTDPTELDTTSFSGLDTDNSSAVGYYSTGEELISEAVAFVLGSIGAVGFPRRSDQKFKVQRFEGVSGASVLTLSEQNLVEIQPLDVELPVWLGAVLYRKNWKPLSGDQISGAVDADRRRFLESEYRRAETRSDSVRTLHPRAQAVEWPGNLSTQAAAIAEAQRRFALFSTQARGFRVKADLDAVETDRLYVVTLTYNDLDRLGVSQARFGLTTAGEDFVALGFAEETEDGLTQLEIWG